MRRTPLVVVAVLILSGAAASVSGADSTTTTTSSTTTTTTTLTKTPAPRRVAALTGLPDPTAVTKRRSALTIKIDNTPQAHPQYGIDKADVVYEEIVEGGITRLGRHLQLEPAHQGRPGPIGPSHRPRNRVSDRRHLRFLRRRAVRHLEYRDGTGEAHPRVQRRRGNVP